jgi:hypothetical protein
MRVGFLEENYADVIYADALNYKTGLERNWRRRAEGMLWS